MPPEVDEHEEQHKNKRKGMVLELPEDGHLTMEECPKTVQGRQVNEKCASCMQIELAFDS
jgi:hypothetical protein